MPANKIIAFILSCAFLILGASPLSVQTGSATAGTNPDTIGMNTRGTNGTLSEFWLAVTAGAPGIVRPEPPRAEAKVEKSAGASTGTMQDAQNTSGEKGAKPLA